MSRGARRSAAALLLAAGLTRCFIAPQAGGELLRHGQTSATDLGQLVLAASSANQAAMPTETYGPDPFFWTYIIVSILLVGLGLFLLTRQFWESRWLMEKINAQKLKFITQEQEVTPLDQFELGRMYTSLKDFPSALAEYEEVEEDFNEVGDTLDPEDSMGALAARAQLHNSKGFALMKLEPPRTAQARREFVRAVTYWPEFPEALINIGKELMKRKRFDVAVRTLNTALKWQPGNQEFSDYAEQARKAMDGELSKEEMKQIVA
eukprot:s2393_g7.t2